MLSLEIYW